MFKKVLKGIKWFFISILGIIVLFILICFIGRGINSITPKNGINESRYVDINGTKQWISIYSENKDNPVLLYVHGGPFYPTSAFDFPMMKKLGKEYTVVNWDQRGVGHNYKKYPAEGKITSDVMIEDGKEMTKYLKETFGVDKIVIWGSSAGSVVAARLIADNPENYYAFLGTSAVEAPVNMRTTFKEVMLEKYKDDPDTVALLEKYDPDTENNLDIDMEAKVKERCSVKDGLKGADFNLLTAMMFNPYAGLNEICLAIMPLSYDNYLDYRYMILPEEYHAQFTREIFPSDVKEFKVPLYYLLGKKDEAPGSNHYAMEKYIDSITAPEKEVRFVEGGHYTATLESETVKEYLHDIKEKNINNK
ncbi:MAG: alpha/beta hydrolase [Eubacterium sp.]|nr:alpha/beta hydrolase [Eubacterium sp.]